MESTAQTDISTFLIACLSLLISMCSVGVAVWAHVRHHSLQKRIVDIEEEREQDRKRDATKADLTASMGRFPSGGHKLVIKNLGESEARDIRVRMDDKPILEHEAVPHNHDEIHSIGPHSEIEYKLGLSSQTGPPFRVEISWSDDSGERGHYKTTVTI